MSALLPSSHARSGAMASAARLAQGGKGQDPALWKTAQQFESMFLENVFSQVTQGLQGEGPLGTESEGGEIWRSMLVDQYARKVSDAGGVGIADNVYRELLKLQEGSSHGAS